QLLEAFGRDFEGARARWRRHRRLGHFARVVLVDGLADCGFGGDDRLHVVAGYELDVVHREDVGRIRHRDGERRAGAAQGNDLILLRRVGRDQLDDAGVDFELREVDRGNAVLLAEEGGDLLVLDEAQADQVEPELAAVRFLTLQRLLKLFSSNALFFEEELSNTDGHRSAELIGRSDKNRRWRKGLKNRSANTKRHPVVQKWATVRTPKMSTAGQSPNFCAWGPSLSCGDPR